MHLISNQIEIYLALNIPRGGGVPYKALPEVQPLILLNTILSEKVFLSYTFN